MQGRGHGGVLGGRDGGVAAVEQLEGLGGIGRHPSRSGSHNEKQGLAVLGVGALEFVDKQLRSLFIGGAIAQAGIGANGFFSGLSGNLFQFRAVRTGGEETRALQSHPIPVHAGVWGATALSRRGTLRCGIGLGILGGKDPLPHTHNGAGDEVFHGVRAHQGHDEYRTHNAIGGAEALGEVTRKPAHAKAQHAQDEKEGRKYRQCQRNHQHIAGNGGRRCGQGICELALPPHGKDRKTYHPHHKSGGGDAGDEAVTPSWPRGGIEPGMPGRHIAHHQPVPHELEGDAQRIAKPSGDAGDEPLVEPIARQNGWGKPQGKKRCGADNAPQVKVADNIGDAGFYPSSFSPNSSHSISNSS